MRGGAPPSKPRALACLVSRDSELAFLLRSLIKLSPPPPPRIPLGAFLILGGFYSEVALQKREAEGTVRTKHQLNLDPNPEGTQKNLDDRRYGGREEQRIPHVGGGAGAAQGVTGHLRALGDLGPVHVKN